MRLIDRVGHRYHRLAVIERAKNAENPKDTNARWLCKCDCGNMIIAYGNDLKREKVKSCGCYNAERILKHGKSGTKAYRTWKHIHQRCYNEKSNAFKNYGARGIAVSDEWKCFDRFFEDMGNPPKGYSIERVDNNKGYSKENCIWAENYKIQLNNTRNNVFLEFKGLSKTISQWSEYLNVNHESIRSRYKAGWSSEKILSTPFKTYKERKKE